LAKLNIMDSESLLWGIALTLFVGALGLPIPENPILLGGGYAIFKHLVPPVAGLLLWYLAIIAGDTILFAASYWFFTRPAMARVLKRLAGPRRFEKYRRVFDTRGGWTLFLARFTFGIRAVAYIAAGAAHYSWKKFFLVDGLSVALQVLLFVGVGFFAGERVDWAQDTGGKIVLTLGIIAAASILITWISSRWLSKTSTRKEGRPPNRR
jgi:membrane protein DedA with SNARE-associated domain